MNLREFLECIGKFGVMKTILAFIVMATPFCFAAYYGGKTVSVSQSTENNIALTATASALNVADPSTSSEQNQCKEKEFDQHAGEWLLKEYGDPDKDGFYCPKTLSGFTSPDMWYKRPLPLDFESMRMTFQVRRDEAEEATVAPFVFSLGDSPRLFRFFVAETDPQLVGFQRISLSTKDKGLVRDEPRGLQDPIKEETQTELTVRPQILQGNNMRYVFNVSYISALTNDPEEDNFSYEVKLPVPNPSEASVKIGIGTFKNSCLKPIKYEICER